VFKNSGEFNLIIKYLAVCDLLVVVCQYVFPVIIEGAVVEKFLVVKAL